jgi:hypothetical protein
MRSKPLLAALRAEDDFFSLFNANVSTSIKGAPMGEDHNTPLADDILEGADRIALFLFGDPKQRRRVYWLAEKQSLPVFRLGQSLCARKSTLRQFIERQEGAANGSNR